MEAFKERLVNVLSKRIHQQLMVEYEVAYKELEDLVEKKNAKEFQLLEKTFQDRLNEINGLIEANNKLGEKHKVDFDKFNRSQVVREYFMPAELMYEIRAQKMKEAMEAEGLKRPNIKAIEDEVIIELAKNSHPETVIDAVTRSILKKNE